MQGRRVVLQLLVDKGSIIASSPISSGLTPRGEGRCTSKILSRMRSSISLTKQVVVAHSGGTFQNDFLWQSSGPSVFVRRIFQALLSTSTGTFQNNFLRYRSSHVVFVRRTCQSLLNTSLQVHKT